MSDILLRFIHISDTHLSHDPEYGLDSIGWQPRQTAEALVEQLNNLPFEPDFVLHTGDVTNEPNPAAYELARELLGRIRHPLHYLAGNHDDSEMLQRVLLQRTTIQPEWYTDFEVKGVHIVCLDSTGPAEPPGGSVSDDQLAWLATICNANDDRPLVVAVHHNILPVGVPVLDEDIRLENGEALHQTLLPARHRLRGVFYGHIHQQSQTLRDGILYNSVPACWYQFQSWPLPAPMTRDLAAQPGFNIVTITPDQTHIRSHRYPRPVL